MLRSVSRIAGWVGLGLAVVGCGGEPGTGSEAVGESTEDWVIKLPPGPLPTATVAPAIADLKPEGTMFLYGTGSTRGLDVHVTNIGNLGAVGTSGFMMVNGTSIPATLHQYNVPPNHPANALYPGKRGYLHGEIPATLLSQCKSFAVHIDYTHNMQYGPPTVYDNDSAIVSTLCPLGWNTPVTAVTLGEPPDAFIANKTLSDIVSSFQSAREDGKRCSTCHFGGAPRPYRPEFVPEGGLGPHITPSTFLDNSTWAGGVSAWSARFIDTTNYLHTDSLRAAFRKWRADGQLL